MPTETWPMPMEIKATFSMFSGSFGSSLGVPFPVSFEPWQLSALAALNPGSFKLWQP